MIFSVILFDQSCVVQVMFLVLYFILHIFLSILLKEIILNLKRLETNKQKKIGGYSRFQYRYRYCYVPSQKNKTRQDKTRQLCEFLNPLHTRRGQHERTEEYTFYLRDCLVRVTCFYIRLSVCENSGKNPLKGFRVVQLECVELIVQRSRDHRES